MKGKMMKEYLSGIALIAVVAIVLPASAAPVEIIDGTGNLAGTYSDANDPNLTFGNALGGGSAIFDSLDNANSSAFMSANNPRPLLGDNTILQADIYVTALLVGDTPQGENRMRITFRNPVGGAQESVNIGDFFSPGDPADMNWFPTQINTWQTFTYDLTTTSWWASDYSTWEVYRPQLYANGGSETDNTFAIRNLQITAVPEPATMSLLALGGLAAILLGRRRKA